MTKDALSNLILAGFLDRLHGYSQGQGRRELLSTVGNLPAKKSQGKSQQKELPVEHPASWWTLRQVSPVRELAGGYATRDREHEELRVLGLNVGRHPLADPGHRNALDTLGVTPSRQILELPHGSRTRAAGILESLQSPPTKSGNQSGFYK